MDYKKYGWRRYAFYAFCAFGWVALITTIYFPENSAWVIALWAITAGLYLLKVKPVLEDLKDEERNRNAYRGR